MANDDHSIFEDEGSGYLVSVSDIMAGLLFIFIITLVAFVMHFQTAAEEKKQEQQVLEQKTKQKDVLLERLTNNRAVREELLTNIERELRARGVEVKVDLKHGVLRLTEEAVRFRSSKAELDEQPKHNLDLISDVLSLLLPCYAKVTDESLKCDIRTTGKLEAVFIEGHTDNVPLRSAVYSNWDLSAKRAIATYQHMLEKNPSLGDLRNLNQEPLFSVAGYAEHRPLYAYTQPTDDARNRRIDIRFIMMPPSKEEADIVEQVHERGVN